MFEAAHGGHVAVAELLIAAGADVNLRNKNQYGPGATPLHCAALTGNLEAVQLLLEHGADKELEMIFGDFGLCRPEYVVCLGFEREARSRHAENHKNKKAIKALLR